MYRYGLALAELTRVVVKLGQAEDIQGDLLNVCLAVLNLDPQWFGNIPSVVSSQYRLESRCSKVTRPLRDLPKRPRTKGQVPER